MKYGFIGLGNMAGAIIAGMAVSGKFSEDTVYGYNRSAQKTEALHEKCGLVPAESAADVAKKSDVVILSVKPQMMDGVLSEIKDCITPEKTVISIAAGLPCARYEGAFEGEIPVVRVMPNINAKVLAAISGICGGKYAKEEDIAIADNIFSTIGKTYRLDEKMFPAFSAIGGASGAFVMMYIDALAEAAVREGFPRAMAEELAEHAVSGAAILAEKSEEHPIALMNSICSPGGTTIEGVCKLKELGFESAVQQGIKAIVEKDRKLG